MATETATLVSKRPATSETSETQQMDDAEVSQMTKRVRLKVDFRLCTIAGLLCSLNLLDSGIISSASVTSMLKDLELDQGNRYSVSILIFTVASVCFQLPATLAVRIVGPRIFFAVITFAFGFITLCTAFIHTWKEMIVLRVLLGISMSGIYPGLALLISSWYRRFVHFGADLSRSVLKLSRKTCFGSERTFYSRDSFVAPFTRSMKQC